MLHNLQFFTEHAWKSFKRVYWTGLNIANAISEHALGQYYYFSFSSVFREHVGNRLSVFRESAQACSVKYFVPEYL